jgi:DNA-binding NarL/FixJ family response regulator
MDSGERSAQPTRVVVADDHSLFRYGLKAMLANAEGFEVVGEATTGEEAVEKVTELEPDIVLMGIQMPGMNGIEVTRSILETNPRVGVVVVTMFEDDDSVFAAMRAGARGYVLKGADVEEVLKVLGAVAEGEAHFGPEIARRLMGYFSTPNPAAPSEVFPELTAREAEVWTSSRRGATTPRSHVIVRAREAGLGRDKA